MDASALSDSAAIPNARPTGWGWRGLTLRAEDWLLAGWIVLAAPLLAVAGGSAGPFDSGHPLTGLLLLTSFAGAIACLATRSSDTSAAPTGMALVDTPSGSDTEPAGPSPARWSILNSGAVGPLVGGLLLVGGTAFAEREGGAIVWLTRFALFLVSVILGIGWLSLLGG